MGVSNVSKLKVELNGLYILKAWAEFIGGTPVLLDGVWSVAEVQGDGREKYCARTAVWARVECWSWTV
jgi:hypothetical protein